MIRSFPVCVALLVLSGCSTLTDDTADDTTSQPALPALPATQPGSYHFGWKLSGNRAVAPLQVFDDGKNTWLQFPPGQVVPAIFVRSALGDQLVTPVAGNGGLLMINGVWPQLVLRGGSLQSVALRLPTEDHTPPTPPTAPKTKTKIKARPQQKTVTSNAAPT